MGRKKSQNPQIAQWARNLWEKASMAENGLEIRYSNEKEAAKARFDLYTARNADRVQNEKIYPAGDPLHGQSVWDIFRVQLVKCPNGDCILRITLHSAEQFTPLSIAEL